MCMFMYGQKCTGPSTHQQMWADSLECWTSPALLFQQNLSVLCVFTASCADRTQVLSHPPVPCHLKRTLNVEVANQSQLLDAFRRSHLRIWHCHCCSVSVIMSLIYLRIAYKGLTNAENIISYNRISLSFTSLHYVTRLTESLSFKSNTAQHIPYDGIWLCIFLICFL